MKNPQKAKQIREFILNNVESHPRDISRITAQEFGVTRPAVGRHLRALVDEDLLIATGATKARKYTLQTLTKKRIDFSVDSALQEDVIWRDNVLPLISETPDNVLDICQYGFTEIFNNVIDHSEADIAWVRVIRNAVRIEIQVHDRGVGIFHNIQRHFQLADPRHALLELSKGKITSDKINHTGEGIFFTSRMFDRFVISSGTLAFVRLNKDNDWLIEVEERNQLNGTAVSMEIHLNATKTARSVLDEYAPEQNEFGFTRTHVPLKLAKYEGEQLVSRSQARRLLARLEGFREVLLDFQDIKFVGQAFADEIFRVYQIEHPDIRLVTTHTSPEVESMILRASKENKQESLQL